MPFKIVQTSEKGAKYLTVVPSKWEVNGVCSFPKNGLTSKQKIEDSLPDETGLRLNSILKRDNIESFVEANAILDILVQQSDTDNEERDVSATRKVQMKKGVETIKNASILPDLNEYLNINQPQEQIVIDQQSVQKQVLTMNPESVHQRSMFYRIVPQELNEPSTLSTHSMNPPTFVQQQQTFVQQQPTFVQHVQQPTMTSVEEVVTADDEMNATWTDLSPFATAEQVSSMNDRVMERMDSIEGQIANIAKSVSELIQTVRFMLQNTPTIQGGNTENVQTERNTSSTLDYSFPIRTIDELQNFEQLLENEVSKKQILTELIRQHGTDVGTGLGVKEIAFDLYAKMFTPQLFTNCSWTGQAFDKNFPGGKFEFQKLNNTIMLFWEVVNTADKSYDLNSNKSFFQKRMFSSKRKTFAAEDGPEKKRIRSSTKRRPKNLKYNRKPPTSRDIGSDELGGGSNENSAALTEAVDGQKNVPELDNDIIKTFEKVIGSDELDGGSNENSTGAVDYQKNGSELDEDLDEEEEEKNENST